MLSHVIRCAICPQRFLNLRQFASKGSSFGVNVQQGFGQYIDAFIGHIKGEVC